jgi:hypothetical protein
MSHSNQPQARQVSNTKHPTLMLQSLRRNYLHSHKQQLEHPCTLARPSRTYPGYHSKSRLHVANALNHHSI